MGSICCVLSESVGSLPLVEVRDICLLADERDFLPSFLCSIRNGRCDTTSHLETSCRRVTSLPTVNLADFLDRVDREVEGREEE